MSETLIFSVFAAGSALMAIVFTDTRRIILSSWFTSMFVGALFLSAGVEYLAVVQWIVGTLVAIVCLIFATMFGEYGQVDFRPVRERVFDFLPAFFIGASFFGMILVAVRGISEGVTEPGISVAPAAPNDLLAVGRALGEQHLLALELVAFLLLAVVVGIGVISRADESPIPAEVDLNE